MKFLTQICRILTGSLFIFSGVIKANDPLGFSYKLKEYFEVFGIEWLVPAAVFLAIFICIFEIVVGLMLLLGFRTKLTLWLLVVMIVFFTFLTFYSAYFNKVQTCGCFGDFLKLTPWQSFSKDVFLLIMIIILCFGHNYIPPIFGDALLKTLLFFGVLAAIAFPVYTYNYLPIWDFRPYKVGTDIYKAIHPQVNYFYLLKNKKTGEKKEFAAWPENWDTQWDYVSNRTENADKSVVPIIGFVMHNEYGEDYADEFLQKEGNKFILVEYDLNKANKKIQGRINDFAAVCALNNVEFVGLTSSDSLTVMNFKKEHHITYPFYTNGDDVPLKTMMRSNPGLMLLDNSTVVHLWHYNSFPSFNDVKDKYFHKP